MSRVIKAATWKEGSCIVDAPVPEIPEVEGVQLDEEGRLRMLAEIAHKEQRAQQMLNDARVECDIMKQEAQAECDRMTEDVTNSLDELKREAMEEGRAEGIRVGREEAEASVREEMRAELLASTARAEKQIKDAEKVIRSLVQESEEQIVDLCMHVVSKVLPQHFVDAPQVVLPVVQKALEKVKDQKEIIIRVAPESFDFVLMARDELRQYLTGGGAVLEISSDESLKAGDCMIDTTNGTVDARLATQLELIRHAVQEVIN